MIYFDTKYSESLNDTFTDDELVIDANRMKLILLCRVAGSYLAAAQLIAKQTQRPLSVDSIKAWTCSPVTKRSRPCPDWAVIALERSLKRFTKKYAKAV